MTSRMLSMPVTYCSSRSKPSPKPACGTVPNLGVRRSRVSGEPCGRARRRKGGVPPQVEVPLVVVHVHVHGLHAGLQRVEVLLTHTAADQFACTRARATSPHQVSRLMGSLPEAAHGTDRGDQQVHGLHGATVLQGKRHVNHTTHTIHTTHARVGLPRRASCRRA